MKLDQDWQLNSTQAKIIYTCLGPEESERRGVISKAFDAADWAVSTIASALMNLVWPKESEFGDGFDLISDEHMSYYRRLWKQEYKQTGQFTVKSRDIPFVKSLLGGVGETLEDSETLSELQADMMIRFLGWISVDLIYETRLLQYRDMIFQMHQRLKDFPDYDGSIPSWTNAQ